MGYFSRLDRAVQSGQGLSAAAPHESDVPARPAIQTAADPAAGPAADLAGQPVPMPAADPAAGRAQPEEEPSPTAVVLDAEADDAARQAHEAAEARRRAEWEARQQAKRTVAQAELDHLASMSDEDIVAASTQRVSADTEKLTRRNMKDCVSEHIQAMCRQDPAFARKAMHPRKSMIHCFWYINRMAQDYMKKRIKANSPHPESGIYGDDVPDNLVYQWAVDYFNDPEVQEDKETEEKFTPRPYVSRSSGSKPAAKPKAKKEAPRKAAAKPQSRSSVDGQLSFMEAAG